MLRGSAIESNLTSKRIWEQVSSGAKLLRVGDLSQQARRRRLPLQPDHGSARDRPPRVALLLRVCAPLLLLLAPGLRSGCHVGATPWRREAVPNLRR